MKMMIFALAGLVCAVVSGIAQARVEADPNKEYNITPEAGPYVILATAYVGPKAPQLAHEMVLEIRSRFDLPAWVINKGDEARNKQQEYWHKLHEQYPDAQIPLRGVRIQEECGVLIGGYKDMNAARKALDHVKKLPPPSDEHLMPLETRVRPVTVGNESLGQIEGRFVNPFPKSFVTRNPTVPHEHQADMRNDPFLKQLNVNESLSLLKCRKPWTLVVATFQGVSIIQPQSEAGGFLSKLLPSKLPDTLSATGENAHNLAELLRNLKTKDGKPAGFEAYVLHMRSGSLVTIGGFDRRDDPSMQSMQQALFGCLQYVQNVAFLQQPFAIEVPRPK